MPLDGLEFARNRLSKASLSHGDNAVTRLSSVHRSRFPQLLLAHLIEGARHPRDRLVAPQLMASALPNVSWRFSLRVHASVIVFMRRNLMSLASLIVLWRLCFRRCALLMVL